MKPKLPILLSVPHAGLQVPPEAEPYCLLTADQIKKDGDEGAAEIYSFENHVEQFVTTNIARAIVDLNRAEDDRRTDGVVKTETIWAEPIYNRTLPTDTIDQLLELYYRPYHEKINDVDDSTIKLCVDCHTMAATGPPIGPDTGQERPHVCLGDLNGHSMPDGWIESLANCFRESFGDSVTINQPFSGGYITRHHSKNRPWLQLELSRATFMPNDEKRENVLKALTNFCSR